MFVPVSKIGMEQMMSSIEAEYEAEVGYKKVLLSRMGIEEGNLSVVSTKLSKNIKLMYLVEWSLVLANINGNRDIVTVEKRAYE